MNPNDREFHELQERYWNRRYEPVECEEEYCYTWCDVECKHRRDDYWLTFEDFLRRDDKKNSA